MFHKDLATAGLLVISSFCKGQKGKMKVSQAKARKRKKVIRMNEDIRQPVLSNLSLGKPEERTGDRNSVIGVHETRRSRAMSLGSKVRSLRSKVRSLV
ncbi:MAG: hypothetical protein QME57_02530, partial [Patescibacteria group bacterium]|nr:hypothetical protein [Patescibacteria group bacterium]